jgi:predicted amidohydrolase YtcJ
MKGSGLAKRPSTNTDGKDLPVDKESMISSGHGRAFDPGEVVIDNWVVDTFYCDNEMVEQAKALEVNLCMQPYWAQLNGMLLSCRDHLGDNRLNSLYAIKDMLANDLNVAFSSDWPVSTPSVLAGITVAVFRQGSVAMPKHNPDQAITLEQAIDAYTNSACKLLGKRA